MDEKPVESLLMERERALGWKPSKTPFVIAFANLKGGVAKTTSSASLAGALTKSGYSVLAVDLDPQANLTLALGLNPGRYRNAISDVLYNAGSLVSISQETSIPGLDLAPSDPNLELAERFLSVMSNHETILRSAIEKMSSNGIVHYAIPNLHQASHYSGLAAVLHSENYLPNQENELRSIYDFLILDCPPSIGTITINALNAADLLIIPTQPEFFSSHALRSMMKTIQQIRSENNPNLGYRILITMVDQRNKIHKIIEQQIRDTFKSGVFDTSIGVDTKLRESSLQGVPITHFTTSSRGARQYFALAQELITYAQTKSL